MAHSKHTVILRRAPGSDPLAAGCKDVTLDVTHLAPVPVIVGANSQSPSGELYGRSTKRWRIDMDCLGFSRTNEGELVQSWGRYVRLVDYVLTGDTGSTLWLWRAYAAGTNTNAPLVRDDYDRTAPEDDEISEGTIWNLSSVAYQVAPETYPYSPAGILPLKIVLDENAEPNHEGGGLYSLSLRFWAAATYTT